MLEIEKIKTGKGLAGSRVALIFAPPEAEPGSLVGLTDFLNEKEGIRAVPGYHGPNENHVLRVSGLPNDAEFLKLLQHEFTTWQNEHAVDIDIHFPEDLQFGDIEEVDHFPHQGAMRRFIKENANTLTGIAYMAGSVGLLMAGWRKPTQMPGMPVHDWLRLYSAASYFTASAVLVAMSQKQDNPRDVYTLMEEMYPKLAQQPDDVIAQQRETSSQVVNFLRNYPWEITMLLNATGAGAHAMSGGLRKRYGEMTAALCTLTACTLSAVIPEKGGRSLLPVNEWLEDAEGRTVLDRLEEFGDNHPNFKGWVNLVGKGLDWMQENPLKIAAGVSAVGNVFYATSGLRQPNYGLTAMAAAYGAGNYTQTHASKGRGDGFDSVVTAAAKALLADPTLNQQDRQAVQSQVSRLVELLADQREIVHTPRRLSRGINARMQRLQISKELEGDDVLTGFLPNEKRILIESPFVKPNHVARVLPNPDETTSAPGV